MREILLENGRFLSASSKMVAVHEAIDTLSGADGVPILIQGETGTGKELVARALHERGPRKSGPFIAVNCSAIPENLLESELFGYEKGAFTDAKVQHRGKIEQAHGGTLLLDEIGDMRMDLQVKLLRVLQDRRVERLGGEQTLEVDVRIVCTTNVSLRRLVNAHKFRLDLFWRIAVATITLPPLRTRPEDIVALFSYYLGYYSERFGRSERPSLSKESIEKLKGHPFPGNVRELESIVQRALLYFPGAVCLGPEHIVLDRIARGAMSTMEIPFGVSLEEVIRRYTLRVLEEMNGNTSRTSKFLKLSLRTLQSRLRRWGEKGLYKP